MGQHVNAERFHALDATRASALMLGIVFHIAWGFVPGNAGTPVTDASSNLGFEYFFFTSHIFRMQVFFLIAGFFARMMFHRRGSLGFAKNRLLRILVPLLLGWIILMPLVLVTWIWGGNHSGQILTPVPLSLSMMGQLLPLLLVPRAMGGLFSLAHLWFLYYLLWLYIIVLGAHLLLGRRLPEESIWKRRADLGIAWCVQSPWAVVLLAVATGLILWRMVGWNGVDTPSQDLLLSTPVLLLYGLFFGFGWLLHRQTKLMREFATHWKLNLALGMVASLALFATYHQLGRYGVTNGEGSRYPRISPNQLVSWPSFLARLQSIGTSPADSEPQLAALWERLPVGDRERIMQLTDQSSIDLQIGVCKSLNKLIVLPELFEPVGRDAAGDPLPVLPRLLDPEQTPRTMRVNRQRLDQLLSGELRPDPMRYAWYTWAKLSFGLVYGLAIWCFVFATLGVFQAWCTHHSPGWRYIADSSYWTYLAHIPLVTFLHVWIAPLPWPGLLKFALLNVVAFGLLLLSYHWLVRSTYIGTLLNGRRYPFVLIPWRSLPHSVRAEQDANPVGERLTSLKESAG